MASCTVTGSIFDLTGTPIGGATVKAYLTTAYFYGTALVVPYELSTTTDTSGGWSLTLQETFSVGRSITISIEYPPNTTDNKVRLDYAIVVPNQSTANFSDLVTEL